MDSSSPSSWHCATACWSHLVSICAVRACKICHKIQFSYERDATRAETGPLRFIDGCAQATGAPKRWVRPSDGCAQATGAPKRLSCMQPTTSLSCMQPTTANLMLSLFINPIGASVGGQGSYCHVLSLTTVAFALINRGFSTRELLLRFVGFAIWCCPFLLIR